YFNNLKRNYVFYAMVITTIIMFISIINSPVKSESFRATGNYILGLFLFIVALFYIDNNSENKKKILFSLMSLSIYLFSLSLLKCIDLYQDGQSLKFIISDQDNILLGWIHPNHSAAIVCICIFAATYCFINCIDIKERIFSIFSILISLSLEVLFLSRAAILALLLSFIVIIIYYAKRVRNKQNNLKLDSIYFISLTLVFLVGIIILTSCGILSGVFDEIKELGFKSSSRKELYEIGFKHFKKHWFIGSGVYSSRYYIETENPTDIVNNYHNYYIQALSCTGILGGFAFTFYIASIIYIIVKSKDNDYKYLLIVILVYMLIHGFFDTIFFNFRIEPLMLILLSLLYDKKNPPKNDENMILNTFSSTINEQ
ncbi:MAG: O-antigen ligase family protein, partial [Acholeplasmatales bacterium]|nr:O-antigen ligase family protein [Acholeplasmatales bacterium]